MVGDGKGGSDIVVASGSSDCGVWDVQALLAKLVTSLKPLGAKERLLFLVKSAPSRMVPFLLRCRYIMIGILSNPPGSAIIGGGGGIASSPG